MPVLKLKHGCLRHPVVALLLSFRQPRCQRFPRRPVALRPFLSKGVPLCKRKKDRCTGLFRMSIGRKLNSPEIVKSRRGRGGSLRPTRQQQHFSISIGDIAVTGAVLYCACRS